jgi:hypothetical protein
LTGGVEFPVQPTIRRFINPTVSAAAIPLVRTVVAVFSILLITALPAAAAGSITVLWDANTEPDLAGYMVSYGNQPGTYTTNIDVGTQTSFPFSVPDNGLPYYFAVRAYNTASQFSPYSAEVAIRPPVLAAPANQAGAPGTVATLQLQATDPDGDPITYAATGLPVGISVNPTSGAISGILPNAPGNYLVTASASDGLMTVVRTFTWTIANGPGGLQGDEIAVDFGSAGLWLLYNNVTWSKLHNLSPGKNASGDVDGNGQADLIIEFPGFGVWVWLNNSSWFQLHTSNVGSIVTGDLDGNGKADVLIDFPGAGIWIWRFGSGWLKLHDLTPRHIVTGDLDANGRAEAIIDFQGAGIWVWSNNASWWKLHQLNAGSMVVGDLDGGGRADLLVDFPGYGIWVWRNNTSWLNLHTLSPSRMVTGDLDGNGQREAIIDFPGAGIWVWQNDTSWWKLHTQASELLTTADLDRNGRADIVIDFGSVGGIWRWMNNIAWIKLHDLSPEGMVVGNLDGN